MFIPRFNITVGINSESAASQSSFCINNSHPPDGKAMNKYVQRTIRGKNIFFAAAENIDPVSGEVSPAHKLIEMLSEEADKLITSGQNRIEDATKAFLTDANGEISSYASANALENYGASCITLCVINGKAKFFNTGNLLGFYYHDRTLRQMSENNSEKISRVPAGVGADDSLTASYTLRPTKYVGCLASGAPLVPFVSETVDIDRDDIFIICSGEICDNLPQSRISYILSLSISDEKIVRRITSEALARGASGDLTVILIRNGGKPFIQKNTISTIVKTVTGVIAAAVLCAFIISFIHSCSKKPAILQEDTPDLPQNTQSSTEFMTRDPSL